jgi:hypothetical protein
VKTGKGIAMKLINSFSFNMLQGSQQSVIKADISLEQAIVLLERNGLESCIGDKGLSRVLSNMLDMEVEYKPQRIRIQDNEQVVFAQFCGDERLSPFAESLPEGTRIVWRTFKVQRPLELGRYSEGHTSVHVPYRRRPAVAMG